MLHNPPRALPVAQTAVAQCAAGLRGWLLARVDHIAMERLSAFR